MLDRDIYGRVDKEKNRERILRERKALQGDYKALSSLIRKQSLTPEEAFRASSQSSIFDTIRLNERLDILSFQEPKFERGNLEWEDMEQDSKVVWVPSGNGRFRIAKQPDRRNPIVFSRGIKCPDPYSPYIIGCDPFSHSITAFGGSKGSIYVFKRFSPFDEDDSNKFVVEYISRPKTVQIFYEDVLKLCHYYGAKVLIENNKIGLVEYFKQRHYEKFMVKLPNKKEYGIAATKATHQYCAELFESYINLYIDKIDFPRLLNDLIRFDINNTTKFDAYMASSYALMASQAMKERVRPNKENAIDINKVFRRKRRV